VAQVLQVADRLRQGGDAIAAQVQLAQAAQAAQAADCR
jgi:hypothetical protein